MKRYSFDDAIELTGMLAIVLALVIAGSKLSA